MEFVFKTTATPVGTLKLIGNDEAFVTALLERGVGIRFNGAEKTNVEEYCVSEGWVRMAAGNAKDRFGNPMTIKVSGPVEPYFKDGN